MRVVVGFFALLLLLLVPSACVASAPMEEGSTTGWKSRAMPYNVPRGYFQSV